MSPRSALLGVASVLALVLTLVFLSGATPPAWLGIAGLVVTLPAFLLMLWDAVRSPRVPNGRRAVWVVGLLLVAGFAMPPFWWHYERA